MAIWKASMACNTPRRRRRANKRVPDAQAGGAFLFETSLSTSQIPSYKPQAITQFPCSKAKKCAAMGAVAMFGI